MTQSLRKATAILHGDRIRTHTPPAVLRQIDEDTAARLQDYTDGNPDHIRRRLDELDREWDTDRTIELEAAATGLVGLALGVFLRRAFLVVPAFVGGALLTHALTGWYPLLPLFRRLGVRSAREIARERYALKALRGDFSEIETRGEMPLSPALRPFPLEQPLEVDQHK